MKLDNLSADITVVGGEVSSSFSIAMNGKAFKVLSDTLYQDKIGSMVREVSCNARDSHVAAGKADVAFEIHLPDNFEPWFSVKDYGLGLSHEDVKNVFTVYFQSTKDQSNDAIGAFGLGAKTPFSYTDQFTVTSVKDGKLTIYSAYITSEYIPNIRVMHEQDTDQPNGVEIKVSAKNEDFYKFHAAVSNQLRFFKVKPVIKNCNYFSFEEIQTSYSSDVIAVSNKVNVYGKLFIVQGDVGYPADVSLLRNKVNKEAKEVLDAFNMLDVQLFFKIGEIGVTASREGIEYNEKTVKNIEDKLIVAGQELRKELENKTQNGCLYDKVSFLNSEKIFRELFRTSVTKDANPDELCFNSNGEIFFNIKNMYRLDNNTHYSVTLYNQEKLRSKPSTYIIGPNTSDKKYVFAIVDVTKNISKIIKALRTEHTNLVVVHPYNCNDITVVEKHFSSKIGNFDNFIYFSDVVLEKKVVVKKKYTRSTVTDIYHVKSMTRSFWEKTTDDTIKNPCVYFTYEGNGTPERMKELISVYIQLKTIDNTLPELYAVRVKSMSKINLPANSIKLDVFVSELKTKLHNDRALHKLLSRLTTVKACVTVVPYNWFGNEKVNNITKGTDIGNLLNNLKEIQSKLSQEHSKVQKSDQMFSALGIKTVTGNRKLLNLFSKKIEKMKKKYLLFTETMKNCYSIDKNLEKHLYVYVQSVYNSDSFALTSNT